MCVLIFSIDLFAEADQSTLTNDYSTMKTGICLEVLAWYSA